MHLHLLSDEQLDNVQQHIVKRAGEIRNDMEAIQSELDCRAGVIGSAVVGSVIHAENRFLQLEIEDDDVWS